ncbi:murein transglycosylase C [Pigmentiphaga humi]|uniref:Murein transglycosylase C n=1 Tax=Pigmentiphaga humi TaxID=2478468 RepID=A0A3P4B537_9BURK|nr:transglycosylase SLT domain-containing protein [Pigmentiphaga humi]VCU70646.1 murein transglycosylase C [Pigmentiphaga humi]
MPDAQLRSSSGQGAVQVRQVMAKWSSSITSYIVGTAAAVAAIAILSVPDLRAQIGQPRVAPAVAQAPAAELNALPADWQPVPARPSHERTVSFLGSVGNGDLAQKLPVIKVSSAQAESLGRYIARKYRVSNEATQMLISTTYGVGQEMGIDPLLLLAIIAIESSFNPFAESHVGAQGLMQVLTRVHVERFQPFGGEQAAWNPVANIRVGAAILKEYIERGGSLIVGLRMYVGVGPDGSSPYGDKVLAERRRLASAAGLSGELPNLAPPPKSAGAMPIPSRAGEAVSVKSAEPDSPAVM